MSEFEVDLKGLNGAIAKEEDVMKSLENEIERLEEVISSSALNRSGLGAIVGTLKNISSNLKNQKSSVGELKDCLTDVISIYKETESNIVGGKTTKSKIQQSIEKLGDILAALLKMEKYGENDDSSVMGGDPVNMSTGNFIYDYVDLKVAGGIPLLFQRHYNALDTRKGTLGVRFLHNYEISLEEKRDEEKIIICMGDGQRKTFARIEDGRYIGERAAFETLTKDENGYQLRLVNGGKYYFSPKGVLTRQEDRNQRGISFIYNEETGLLQKAENDDGNYLTYQYDEAGRLICVSDIEDRKVLLSYDDRYLTQVQMADGNIISYAYNEEGRIETITNAEQIVILKNGYEKEQRVVRQNFPDGGYMTFAYDDAGHKTTMIERNGSKTIYVQDEKYRNTAILYEDGTSEHFEYNERNQKIKAVDRNGHTCQMAYDHRGNLTQVINENGIKVNYTYDSNNKLLCLKVNGKEKLHNTYDARGNLLTAESAEGEISKAVYDEKGRVVKLEKGKGNVNYLSYDANGNIEKITDVFGNETTYLYDRLGRAIETTDANGNKTTYEYDKKDRITRVVNALGAERKYKYTATGKVKEIIDFDGHMMQASYNCINKVERFTDKEGNETHFTYDKMWNVAEKITPDGAKHSFIYNMDNRLECVQLPGDGTITYTYDAVGNRTGITDAEGNHTAFTYDALNRLSQVTEENGAKTYYTYDEDGNLTKVTDACGGEWHYTYDARGRRLSKTDPLGNTTSVCYNHIGKIERVCYPNGSSMTYEYEANGRLAGVVRPSGASESYTYDGNGNLIRRTNGLGETATMKYDGLNRLIAITNPAGGMRTYQYDAVGHMTVQVDENGNQTRFEYSPNGNLTKVIDALGNEIYHTYDCLGRLIKTERIGEMENAVHETNYQWNLAGNMEEMSNPLGEAEHYVYSKNGRLIEKTDRDGYRTKYEYNHAGKITDILYADGRSVKFSYDALHRLEEMTDWNGTTKITLDAMGRPLAVTDPMGQTVGYEWGSMGEKTALIYPDGKRAEYSYDDAMHLMTLHTEQKEIRYQYDNAGRIAKKHLPGGVTTRYAYNSLGRVAEIYHEGTEESESYQYDYDVAGNKIAATKLRSGIEADTGIFGYAYDALNRLTEVTKDGEVLRQYGYDAFGNRSRKLDYTGDTLLEITYRYNSNNQLITELEGNTKTAYQYDLRGNLTEVMQGDKLLQQFTFDASNRMTEVTGMADGMLKKAGYEYNGFGQRIGQEIWQEDAKIQQRTAGFPADPKQSIRYTLDMTKRYHNLLQLEDSKNSRSQTFYWDGNVVSIEEAGMESYYLQDDLGTPMSLFDAEGILREAYGYDEFGVPVQIQNSQGMDMQTSIRRNDGVCEKLQPFGFTGYQMEEVSGLYFAQARRYDAQIGRFISEDPMKDGRNWYTYVANDPQNKIDPLGLICFDAGQDADIAPYWMDVLGWWWRNCATPYKLWAAWTKSGMGDWFFDAVDFEKGEDGNYHVNTEKYSDLTALYKPYLEEISPELADFLAFGCWQQLGGYNDFYDYVFDIFCDMDIKKYSFDGTDGESYTIWMWKGEYLNLGAGAECGLYYGDGWQKWAATDNAVPMTLDIDYGDGTSSQYSDTTWWITSFNPEHQDARASDLTVTGTIDFSDVSDDIWNGFVDAYDSSEWGFEINYDNRIVTYTW